METLGSIIGIIIAVIIWIGVIMILRNPIQGAYLIFKFIFWVFESVSKILKKFFTLNSSSYNGPPPTGSYNPRPRIKEFSHSSAGSTLKQIDELGVHSSWPDEQKRSFLIKEYGKYNNWRHKMNPIVKVRLELLKLSQ
jgi:hypothetical protein